MNKLIVNAPGEMPVFGGYHNDSAGSTLICDSDIIIQGQRVVTTEDLENLQNLITTLQDRVTELEKASLHPYPQQLTPHMVPAPEPEPDTFNANHSLTEFRSDT